MTLLQKIEEEARQLSRDEKESLVYTLLLDIEQSKADEEKEIEAAWIQEAEKRLEDYKAGKTSGIPAETVLKEIKDKLL